MKQTPKFIFDSELLERIDSASNCTVYFFSNSTVAVMAKLSEMLLWPTRWYGNNLDVPDIAWRIYRELNMAGCDLLELGRVIGEAVSCSVVVNNNNGCCGNVGDVLPDGTIIQPPLQPPNPAWEGELGGDIEDGGGGLTDTLEICRLAYACWEYQGVILDILVKLDGGLLVLGIVAAIVAAFLPETWAVLITGASAVSLTAVLSSLGETAAVIFGASGAIDNLFAQKDDIICEFVESLGGTAVDVENQFEAAMLAVYGSLVNDELMADVIRITEASGIADWIAERVFDNGDFQPLNFPEGYECCPSLASSEKAVCFDNDARTLVDGEFIEIDGFDIMYNQEYLIAGDPANRMKFTVYTRDPTDERELCWGIEDVTSIVCEFTPLDLGDYTINCRHNGVDFDVVITGDNVDTITIISEKFCIDNEGQFPGASFIFKPSE